MIFAIVVYGCFLGWFRFFRISNLGLAFGSFSDGGRYPAFTGVIYIFLYVICIVLLFSPELITSLTNDSDWSKLLDFEVSVLHLSYFSACVVFAEICRAINAIEGDNNTQKDENENFMDLLKSLSPGYYVEGSFENALGFETCAAIEISAWLYGIRPDVKRSLIIAVSKEFHILRYHRLEVLDFFNAQTGKKEPAKRALKTFVRKHGAGTAASTEFLEKIAKIGRRSGFTVSDVRNGLTSISELLGISKDALNSILKRAEKTSTDHDYRDFRADTFWKQHESRTQQTYSQQDSSQKDYSSQQEYYRSRSSQYRSRSSHNSSRSNPLNDRQEYLKVLGLADGATDKEIRTAYRKVAMKNHPDRVQADGGTEKDVETATEKMSIINTAYDWLCDNPA